MLALLIFAVTFLLVLVGAVIWLYPGSRRVSTIPGLDASDSKRGNREDISKAGGLHPFLRELHRECGSIASYWMDEEFIVSIASPELFKEHSKVFDKPMIHNQFFEPLLTTYSLMYANGGDGRRRRESYDKHFTHEAVTNNYMPIFQQAGDEVMKTLVDIPKDEHVPLETHMMKYSLLAVGQAVLGKKFKDQTVFRPFEKSFYTCLDFLEKSAEKEENDGPSLKEFEKEKEHIMEIIRGILKKRSSEKSDDRPFVDLLLKSGLSESIAASDALTYLVGAVHTSGLLLTWCLYYLASHPDIQEKCHQELAKVLGEKTLQKSSITDLKYMRQVVDETMRCSTLTPTTARYQNMDSELGGHIVPAGTPVVHALGIVLEDEKHWPEPDKFNPDRFGKSPAPFTFEPFGFSGKRKCPGLNFAYIEVLSFLSIVLRKFKLKSVAGQDIHKVYSVVTKPSDDIYVTLAKR